MPETTLFTREIFTDPKDGKRKAKWKCGPLKGREEYSVHRDGSLRHSYPQFKGSKKNRRRFKVAVERAITAPLPAGHDELKETDDVVAGDLLFDVLQGKWVPTPYCSCTLEDLLKTFAIYPRACRQIKEKK